MQGELFEFTKNAAYAMWLVTGNDDTMKLWYCSEDIACHFLKQGFLTHDAVERILKTDKNDLEYIAFVRHIAYRLYLYTGRECPLDNWFDSENLMFNGLWLDNTIHMAAAIDQVVHSEGGNSPWVKNYFGYFRI